MGLTVNASGTNVVEPGDNTGEAEGRCSESSIGGGDVIYGVFGWATTGADIVESADTSSLMHSARGVDSELEVD